MTFLHLQVVPIFGSTNGILKFDGNRWVTIKNSFETFAVSNHDDVLFAAVTEIW